MAKRLAKDLRLSRWSPSGRMSPREHLGFGTAARVVCDPPHPEQDGTVAAGMRAVEMIRAKRFGAACERGRLTTRIVAVVDAPGNLAASFSCPARRMR